MKRNAIWILLALCATTAGAEEKNRPVWNDIKQHTTFGGYVIGSAAYSSQELGGSRESHTSFSLRLIRAYVDGKVWDFKYKLQMEMSGVGGTGTGNGNGPRVLDAWAEWSRYKFVAVKFGQFKRGFTFENPMNPWDIGYGAYSQATSRLAGMSDRTGEHSCGGRDIGIQVQGDLFPSQKDGHTWLHYQIGAYNGQGINRSDRNDNKDVIGGLWVSPVKDLNIGAFGWTGAYSGTAGGRKVTVDRNRMAFGVKYESRWTVRGEYITSEGHKVSDYSFSEDGTMHVSGSNHADAWYATIGVPVTGHCKVYAKWDVYRDRKTFGSAKSIYTIAANYYFYKNLKLQGLYGYVHDKTAASDPHYHTAELQLYWRF